MRRLTLPILALLAFCLPAVAHATPITYSFTGFLTYDGNLGVTNDSVSGTLSWDNVVADTNADPTFGEYPGAALSFALNVGGQSFSGTSGKLTIVDDFLNGGLIYDTFLAEFDPITGPSGSPYDGGFVEFGMTHTFLTPPFNPTDPVTPFNSDAIPTTLSLADFPGLAPFSNPPQVFIRQKDFRFATTAFLTSFTLQQEEVPLAPVPEPATMTLVGLGGAIMLAKRMRKRK